VDSRLELINALLLLSKQCEHVARLLSTDILSELPPETELIQLPDSSKSLDIRQFEFWPSAANHPNAYWKVVSKQQAQDVKFDLSNAKILEYSNGPSIPIGHAFQNTEVELVCNTYKFGPDDQPPSVKIINSLEEAEGPYDIGIIYESLEFDQDPVVTLLKIKQRIKPQGKIYIRFRPWSSRDGGFQSGYFNKAFAHLLMDLESNQLVRNRVVRPLATYESILNKAKMRVLSRKITSITPDDYIISNPEYLEILINRTWGTIKPEDAIKIMATTAIDFLVQVC